ncbi:YeiH family protein [Acetonema longum]|uniref:Uncharacterized protein n=1 Tax=Acetonema longum DSM 6540 TaxID=1009370 RepID=F7NHC5_9FIRM|nr:YeiH family protein [Acetonema longum]EGO64608.1 hypothetical protein ALO_07353 [Acetonema longum DSM 6540]
MKLNLESIRSKSPGVLLVAFIAIPAWLIGKMLPIIGGPVLGILFGMILASWQRPARFEAGVKYTSKQLLQYAIILLGFEMNLFNVLAVGSQTLALMIFTLTAVFVTAYIAGRLLNIDSNTRTLIGVGTAICGGSAIAATAPVIRSTDEEVAHAISTIFLFNVIAAFAFPLMGHALGMSDQAFGLWTGTAVNDTSSVVAAGYSYSNQAGDLAVIVKLTRSLMIVPITLVLALYTSRSSAGYEPAGKNNGGCRIAAIFPWFILGFLGASVINTFFAIPWDINSLMGQTGKFVIIMAMAAIGLNTNLVKLLKSGGKSLLLGLICWVVLAVTALGLESILFEI